MTWTKLTDTFAVNPRWEKVSVHAFALHVAALCDCAQKLTDGHLTSKAVRRLPIVDDPESAAQELVAAGIWEETEGGYWIPDYLDDQESAAQVHRRLKLAAERQRKYRDSVQANREKRNGVTNGVTDSVSNASPSRPAPLRSDRKGGEEKGGEGAFGSAPLALRGPTAPTPEFKITVVGDES